MNATAANLMEGVLPPESGLRQWVLTFPWRRRLAQDGALLGRLTRIAVETVLRFYAARAMEEGRPAAKSGEVTAWSETTALTKFLDSFPTVSRGQAVAALEAASEAVSAGARSAR